jgi:hypothetical protein
MNYVEPVKYRYKVGTDIKLQMFALAAPVTIGWISFSYSGREDGWLWGMIFGLVLVFAILFLPFIMIIRHARQCEWVELSPAGAIFGRKYGFDPILIRWEDLRYVAAKGLHEYRFFSKKKAMSVYIGIMDDPDAFEKHLIELVPPHVDLPVELRQT